MKQKPIKFDNIDELIKWLDENKNNLVDTALEYEPDGTYTETNVYKIGKKYYALYITGMEQYYRQILYIYDHDSKKQYYELIPVKRKTRKVVYYEEI